MVEEFGGVRDVTGLEYRNRWKADAILLTIGAVYSLV